MPQTRLRVARDMHRQDAPVIDVAAPVRGIKPYPSVSSLDEIQCRPEQVALKLDWNEATVPPSPKALKAIADFLGGADHLNWYPVLNSVNLVEKLAEFHDLEAERFLVTNGSDDALNTICTTYLNIDDTVLVASPSYTHFLVSAQTRGAQIVHHYNRDPFKNDVEGLVTALTASQPKILYLVNPNNPTGVLYTPAEVARLLEAAPSTLVIVDEAYSEFSGGSCLELLHQYPNLVVTRTFSKAYGMAGLRIGYAVSSPRIVTDLQRVFNPKSVNVLAQVGAIAALDDQEWLDWYVGEVSAAKVLMAEWLEARGMTFQITAANFVMIRFEQAPWVVQVLREEGVYVRDRSSMPQLAGYARFSVGTVEQTHEVLRRLENVLARLGR